MAFDLGAGLMSIANSALGWARQDQNNNFARDQAQVNRDFQENLSNTAYQRAMADMKAAGLNPMLAYSQGGSSVPVGATASPSGGGLDSGLSSAYAAFRRAEVEADTQPRFASAAEDQGQAAVTNAETGIRRQRSDQRLTDATVDKVEQEILNLSSDRQRVEAVTRNLSAEFSKILEETSNIQAAREQIRATVSKLQAEIPYLRSATFLNAANAFLSQANARLVGVNTGLGEVDLRAAQSFGELGKTTEKLRPFLELLWNVFRR